MRATRGFTLAEVLIAIAIIGVAFGVLAATQVTTMQVTSESRRASDATDFANEELEAAVLDVLSNYADRYSQCSVEGGCPTVDVGEGRFAGTVTIEREGIGYLEEGLMRVTVVVTQPAAVQFTRLVSCIDSDPPPSVAAHEPCPPPVKKDGS